MTVLVIGIILFLGIHAVPWTPLKADLTGRLGEKRYKGLFAVVALVGLALMVWGFIIMRNGPDAGRMVYDPPTWGRHVTMLLVLLAFIALAAAHMKGNIRLWLQNPMSVGVGLWAVGHLLANGSLGEVLLFGTFLFLAVADIIRNMAAGRRPVYEPQMKYDIRAVAGGVVVYGALLFLHPYLFGVPVIQ